LGAARQKELRLFRLSGRGGEQNKRGPWRAPVASGRIAAKKSGRQALRGFTPVDRRKMEIFRKRIGRPGGVLQALSPGKDSLRTWNGGSTLGVSGTKTRIDDSEKRWESR